MKSCSINALVCDSGSRPKCRYLAYLVGIELASFSAPPRSLAEHRELAKGGAGIAVAPYGRLIDVKA